MFEIGVGNNIHSDCNVFNIVLLYEMVLIMLLFNYECIILVLTSILDDIHLLHTSVYICFYIELTTISVSLVNVTMMDLWKIKK